MYVNATRFPPGRFDGRGPARQDMAARHPAMLAGPMRIAASNIARCAIAGKTVVKARFSTDNSVTVTQIDLC
jgi:hypothetical protein